MEKLDEWRKSPQVYFGAKPLKEKIALAFPGLAPAAGLFVGYVIFDQVCRKIWPPEVHPEHDIFSYEIQGNNHGNNSPHHDESHNTPHSKKGSKIEKSHH